MTRSPRGRAHSFPEVDLLVLAHDGEAVPRGLWPLVARHLLSPSWNLATSQSHYSTTIISVGDAKRVMRCHWDPKLDHFRRLLEFLQDFLLHRFPFGGLLHIPTIHGHYNFFRALEERWRFETHTFCYPFGELTVLPDQ